MGPQPATTEWSSLPLEIRQMILETAIQQTPPDWSSIASVCKEWQFFIEKKNFRRLKLQPSCLDHFQLIAKSRQHLVRHIWLNVPLPEDQPWLYSCASSPLISEAICKLFTILSTWEPSAYGLTLELNAYCPFDFKRAPLNNHFFKSDIERYQDEEVHSTDPDPLPVETRPALRGHEPRGIQHVFGATRLNLRDDLPQVQAVTRLIIRRQLRGWLIPGPMLRMLNKLVRLEEFTFEPWRVFEQGWSIINDNQWKICLAQNLLPKTLKKLVIFEDFRDDLAVEMRALVTGDKPAVPGQLPLVRLTRVVDPELGAVFAAKSLDLEQLSVAYMVNAEDFFQACDSAWRWERLESLVLTSRMLRRHEEVADRKGINTLLYTAGMTALRMPKLRRLALWYGVKESAFAFIYRVDEGAAFLTCRATWKLDEEISSEVVELWERVALESHSCWLRVGRHLISSDLVRSHGEAIHLLDLPCQVVTPASLWQIREEHEGLST